MNTLALAASALLAVLVVVWGMVAAARRQGRLAATTALEAAEAQSTVKALKARKAIDDDLANTINADADLVARARAAGVSNPKPK